MRRPDAGAAAAVDRGCSPRSLSGDAYGRVRVDSVRTQPRLPEGLSPRAPSPLPIYDSWAGVLTQNHSIVTSQNPIYESRALRGAISRIRSAAHSQSPQTQTEVMAYTLAAEEAQKARKLAVEEAFDSRRHDVMASIYHLHPRKRGVLTTARKPEKMQLELSATRQRFARAKTAAMMAAMMPMHAKVLPRGDASADAAGTATAAAAFRPTSAPGIATGDGAARHSAAAAEESARPTTSTGSSRASAAAATAAAASAANANAANVDAAATAADAYPSPSTSTFAPTARPATAAPAMRFGRRPTSRGALGSHLDKSTHSVLGPSARRPATAQGGARFALQGYDEFAGGGGGGGGAASSVTPADNALHQRFRTHPAALTSRWNPAVSAAPGAAAAAPAPVPAPAGRLVLGRDGFSLDARAADDDDGIGPSEAAPATPAMKEARRLRNLRAKVRRILREAVRLAAQDAAFAASSSGINLTDFAKLAHVAMEVRRAAEALRQSDLFHDLGEMQLSMMASAGKRRSQKRYDVLYREGAPSHNFFVLVRGSIAEQSTTTSEIVTHTASRTGGSRGYVLFGMEAIHGKPRASTISALADVEVIKFSTSGLNMSDSNASKVAQKVFHSFVEGELSCMSLFKGLAAKTLKLVVPLFFLEEHEAGTKLFDVGNPGDKVYILMHGSITIQKGKQVLNTLVSEQGTSAKTEAGLPVFGEMAMIDRKTRMAAAYAATDCKLLVLPVEQFAACMLLVPDIKARLRRLKDVRRVSNQRHSGVR